MGDQISKFLDVPHTSPKVPNWMRYFLVVCILCNIVSYAVVTYFTIKEINNEIEGAKYDVNIGWKPSEREQRPQNYVEDLKHRKLKIMVGSVVEIMLDSVDLINLFVDSHCLHLMYAITKMLSVGSWTLAQADLRITPLWFIPIGIAMLITVVMQEWFEQYRRWALTLLAAISSLAWSVIAVVRTIQTHQHLDEANERMIQDQGNRVQYSVFIEELNNNKIQFIVGAVFMVLVTITTLVAVVTAITWLCVAVAFLLLVGNVLWTVKLLTDSHLVLNTLFLLPLVYSVLIFIILIIYMYNSHSFSDSNGAKPIVRQKQNYPRSKVKLKR